MPVVHILAIGNELLNGSIQDTNSAYLCRALNDLGFAPAKVVLLRDIDGDIAAEISRAATTADLIITTGGLGPTSDDRTRYVLAEVLGVPLVEDAGARKKLEAIFASRKRVMSETNLRQVQFPDGSEIIENREGTADAFLCRIKSGDRSVPIISLPGIPRELKSLTTEKLIPWFVKSFPGLRIVPKRFLRCFGRSESYLGKKIEELQFSNLIEVAYRPMFPEILLSFSHLGEENEVRAYGELDFVVEAVSASVGREFAFSQEADGTMARSVAGLLLNEKLSITAAESCSGGIIADSLVAIPGISQSFMGSFVVYSNEMKQGVLGVKPETIQNFGAVSGETAIEMARGARERTLADIAVSVTGIAGPDGGTPAKPVGTFWMGLSTKDGEEAIPQFYNLERNLFRVFTATAALDLVRRKILGLDLHWQRL